MIFPQARCACILNRNQCILIKFAMYFQAVQVVIAGPHSSVSSIADLRTGHWFDPRLSQYSFLRLMIVIATGFIPLSLLAVRCFDNGYVGRQPVAWEEYCVEYWL